MVDLKISKKRFKRKSLTSSIALRVFLVSFVVLVIPLCFHAFFTFKQEYNQKIRDLFISLNILGRSHSSLIETEMQFYKQVLDIVEEEINFSKEKGATVNAYLRKIAWITQTKDVFYLASEDSKLICKFSSADELLNKDVSFFQDILSKENFVFAPKKSLAPSIIYISNTIYEQNKPIGALLIGVPITEFISRLTLKEEVSYFIDLSLINSQNEVIHSSDKTLVGKLNLVPFKKTANSFWIEKDFDKRFAVKVPIKDTEFYLLFDIAKKHIVEMQKKDFIFKMLSLIFFFVVIGGSIAFAFITFLSKPLYNLFETMQKISEGKIDERFNKTGMGFEINILGEFFNSTMDSLIFHQKMAEEENLQKQKLQQELKIGHDIQLNMFPTSFLDLPKVEAAPGYLSAKEVSGDFYDLFLKEGGRDLFIAIADASGKGISACLYSLNIRSALRAFTTTFSNLEDIVVATNNLFIKDTKETGMFVTTWLALFDEKKNILHYTSCGHPGALLKKHDGSLIELQTEGMALGVEPIKKVEVKKVHLEENDLLVLYTDGVSEARNAKKEQFNVTRIIEFLNKSKNTLPSDVVDKLLKEIKAFTQNEPQSDDITVLAMRFLAKE
ncbi:MAG: SpoIIE family protein phosphatase [Chlamydiae bacterium]|nr:SpoIIE family protein phosphatase [Chlamydiota bacterium]